jgi:hypothetical protein
MTRLFDRQTQIRQSHLFQELGLLPSSGYHWSTCHLDGKSIQWQRRPGTPSFWEDLLGDG